MRDIKYIDLLGWLAYNFPGVHNKWIDKLNGESFIMQQTRIRK